MLDGQEGAIAVLLRSFPAGVSADHPDLALAHAAVELAQGRLEEAAAQLALGEFHVQSVAPNRRRRLAVAIASLRLALARRSGKFMEAMEQVNLLEASIADESSQEIAMGSELRAVALMNLGIVETWSGRFDDAERHLAEGAALAQAIGRPYIEVACRAYQAFPSVSLAPARERGLYALELADRYGFGDRPVLAPALGALASMAVWTGDFEEGERWLRRGGDVIRADIDPAAAVLLHTVTGMLHAGRGEHQSSLEAFTAAMQAQSLLTVRTSSGAWSRSGSPSHKLVSLCQTKRAPRWTGSQPNTSGSTPSISGERQLAWRRQICCGASSPRRRSGHEAARRLPRVRTRGGTGARRPRAPGFGRSDRRRCRSRGGPRCC